MTLVLSETVGDVAVPTLITGDFVDAATAARIGLANEVVAHDDVVTRATTLAQSMAELDPLMVSEMRRDWDETSALPLAEAHRVHLERSRRLYADRAGAGAAGLAEHRAAVIERSRRQRSRDGGSAAG